MNIREISKGLMLFGLAFVAVIGVRFAFAGDGHSHHNHGKAGKPAAKAEGKQKKANGAAYPLDTCPVTGEKLGSMGDPVVYNHKGREIKFCCSGCIDEFKANAPKYIAEIDKKIIAKQVKTYPLKTCVVTDEALGSMGDPVDYVYNNRLVRFCCKGCLDNFNADPAKYLKKIDAAKAKSKS